MATSFEHVPIDDNVPATRKIGGQELVQGADTLFLQGTLPMGNVLEHVYTAALADAATVTIALTGQENYVIVSTLDTVTGAQFTLAAKDLNGTAVQPVYWQLFTEFAAVSSPVLTTLYAGYAGGTDFGVFAFPTAGLSEISLTNMTGSARSIDVARVSALGLVPPLSTVTKRFEGYYAVVGSGSVSSGQVMTGAGQPIIPGSHLGGRTLRVVAVNVNLVAATTAPSSVDLQFLIGDASAEGDAVPTDYSNYLAMPLEFRTTPTAGQYKSVASGQYMFGTATGLDLPFVVSDAGDGTMFNWIMVARAATTGVTDITVNFIVEL